MIVDVFRYDDMYIEAQCRMYELRGLVDRFIALRSTDRSGPDGDDRLGRLRSRYPVDQFREEDVDGVIREFGADTLFIWGEVQAIPRRADIMTALEAYAFDDGPRTFRMPRLVYSMHYQTDRDVWGPVVGFHRDLTNTFDTTLASRRGYKGITDTGWCLEFFGGEVRLQELLARHEVEQVRMARKTIAERYPRDHIAPDGKILVPFTDPGPDWYEDGHAPASWGLTW